MKIVSIEIENFRRISNARIDPDGSVVVIGGKNKAGKSSVLDAIQSALLGKKSFPDTPVKTGQDKAEIKVECDGITATRRIKPDGSHTLKLTTSDGMSPQAPQEWLQSRIGAISFNPAEFCNMDEKSRADKLRELAGLDTSEIDAERKTTYAGRTEIGRQAKQADALVKSLQHHDDAPEEEQSASSLILDIETANNIASILRDNRDVAERRIESAKKRRDESVRMKKEAEEMLRQAAELLEDAKKLRDEAKRDIEKADEDEKGLVDIEALKTKLSSIEDINQKVRDNKTHDEAAKSAKALKAQWDDATKKLADLDKKRAGMIKKAKLPLKGLGFSDDGVVTYNDLPFSDASMAEKLRVGVAMAAAMNSEFKLILLRDASLLDEDSMAEIARLADEYELQVWLERVGSRDDGAIVMEEGAVAG